MLDSVFCARGGDYVNEITWKRTSNHNDSKRNFSNLNDIIFLYVKSNAYLFNPQHTSYSQDYIKTNFRYKDEDGRFYSSDNLRSPNPRPNLTYDYKGYKPHANGWTVSRERMEELDKQDRLIFPSSHTGRIRVKKYLDEMPGVVIGNVWDDIQAISSQAAERLGYPTQKPEALLERIIQASSNEGDTVLDAYCGCGTTVAVAQRLRRSWIGIDITYQSIAVILKRLEDGFGAAVMDAVVLDGIPRDMESARALANKKDDRVRKEFEKWALLTFSKNRATINEKKGADRGVDGIAYIATGSDTTERVIFQVKSGAVKRNDIATLHGDMMREGAVMAVFLTLEEPTKPMRDEALAAGVYHHALLDRDYPRIQIITVREMIEDGKRIDLPLSLAVLKTAATVKTEEQHTLALD